MSVKINDIPATTTFQSMTAPTAVAGNNSNLVANSAHTRSYMSSVGKIFNDGFTYTISNTKTLTTLLFGGHTLTTGINAQAGISNVGTSLATAVNIATSTTPAGNLYIGGTQQPLLNSGTAGYSIPAVAGGNNCKVQCFILPGISDTGTTVLFPIAYTSTLPTICACSYGATPKLVTLYQPSGVTSQTGFGIACQGGGDVIVVVMGSR